MCFQVTSVFPTVHSPHHTCKKCDFYRLPSLACRKEAPRRPEAPGPESLEKEAELRPPEANEAPAEIEVRKQAPAEAEAPTAEWSDAEPEEGVTSPETSIKKKVTRKKVRIKPKAKLKDGLLEADEEVVFEGHGLHESGWPSPVLLSVFIWYMFCADA